MPGKIVNEKAVTLAEVKLLLEHKGKEQLDPFQLRTYEYISKFTKVDENKAEELVDVLVEKFSVERDLAVQIVNCMPKSTEELQVFFSAGKHRILLSSQLQEILDVVKKYQIEK
jgi:DNA-directed RNA polymerase subunit F